MSSKIVDANKKLHAVIAMLQQQEKQESKSKAKQDAQEAAAQAFYAKLTAVASTAVSLASPRVAYGGAKLSVSGIAYIDFDRAAAVFTNAGYAEYAFTATDDGAYLADFVVYAEKAKPISATMSNPMANLGNASSKFDGVETTVSVGSTHVLIAKNFKRGDYVRASLNGDDSVGFMSCEISWLK